MTDAEINVAATNCFIVASLYVILSMFCGWQTLLHRRQKRAQELELPVGENDAAVVGDLGTTSSQIPADYYSAVGATSPRGRSEKMPAALSP